MLCGEERTELSTRYLRKKNLEKVKKLIDKIKALPEKVAFVIGLTLILGSGLLLFLLSYLFSFGIWTTMIVQGIVFGVAFIFISSAADKRHPPIDKKSNALFFND